MDSCLSESPGAYFTEELRLSLSWETDLPVSEGLPGELSQVVHRVERSSLGLEESASYSSESTASLWCRLFLKSKFTPDYDLTVHIVNYPRRTWKDQLNYEDKGVLPAIHNPPWARSFKFIQKYQLIPMYCLIVCVTRTHCCCFRSISREQGPLFSKGAISSICLWVELSMWSQDYVCVYMQAVCLFEWFAQ